MVNNQIIKNTLDLSIKSFFYNKKGFFNKDACSQGF